MAVAATDSGRESQRRIRLQGALTKDTRKKDDADNESEGSGDIALKEKPEPPPSWDDDEHPLAENYNLMAHFILGDCYVYNRTSAAAEYLFQRRCDEVIEDPKKE